MWCGCGDGGAGGWLWCRSAVLLGWLCSSALCWLWCRLPVAVVVCDSNFKGDVARSGSVPMSQPQFYDCRTTALSLLKAGEKCTPYSLLDQHKMTRSQLSSVEKLCGCGLFVWLLCVCGLFSMGSLLQRVDPLTWTYHVQHFRTIQLHYWRVHLGRFDPPTHTHYFGNVQKASFTINCNTMHVRAWPSLTFVTSPQNSCKKVSDKKPRKVLQNHKNFENRVFRTQILEKLQKILPIFLARASHAIKIFPSFFRIETTMLAPTSL
jgi:hypothetical protein